MPEPAQVRSSNELARLHAAVIADILDEKGYRDQAMDPSIRPLDSGLPVFGRALTALAITTDEIPEEPYRRELEAVDALSENEVLVAQITGEGRCGFWGELLATAALSKGANGVVTNGYTRDSGALMSMKFPLFSRGACPLDSKGRADVISYGEPVECGGVAVESGDFIFGDADGVVVVPAAMVDEVLDGALAKVGIEGEMRKALKQGMPVMDAYDKYGVL